MAEIALPAGYDFTAEDWDYDVPAQRNRSGWTSRSRSVGLPGAALWYATVTVEPLVTEYDEAEWRWFVVSMDGVGNWFRLPASCKQTTAANPTIRTGASTATSIPLQGLPASQTVLKRGQFMTVPLPSGHARLACLTAPLVTNGQGQATASFRPELNETPIGGASVEIRDPYVPSRFANRRNGWQRKGATTTFQFDVEEAL